MNSIFRFPGGKTRKNVRERILAKAPEFQQYREPFVGGGGIFFSIPPDIDRWINDIDPNLMSVYLALKMSSSEFVGKCRGVSPQKEGEPLTSARPGGKKIYNARLKKVFDEFSFNESMDQALRYFFVNRTVWGGRVNYDIPSRMYFSNPQGWNIVGTDKLEQAAKLMEKTEITIGSYEPLLWLPGNDVWIYCDPPYVVNTNLARSSQLYKHGFDLEDHEKFAEAVKLSPHKVCISYDDDDEGIIRELFKDFSIDEEEWAYCGTSSAKGCSKKKRKGKELLITNYT
jgi:DNA adenine methylase